MRLSRRRAQTRQRCPRSIEPPKPSQRLAHRLPCWSVAPHYQHAHFDTNEHAIANGAVVRFGTTGQVCINAGQSPSHIVLDVTGYLPGP